MIDIVNVLISAERRAWAPRPRPPVARREERRSYSTWRCPTRNTPSSRPPTLPASSAVASATAELSAMSTSR
ncbi:hypothetical protein GS901_26570 [Rhodococcus hoagii]|nr:hypothetical protein [Prescottella equi]